MYHCQTFFVIGESVSLELDTDRPYTYHADHVKQYPPAKKINKTYKNKKNNINNLSNTQLFFQFIIIIIYLLIQFIIISFSSFPITNLRKSLPIVKDIS